MSSDLVAVKGFNNSINFSQAIFVGGIAMGWSYVNPSSSLGYLSALVAGVTGGILGGITSNIAYDEYDKWRHRVLPHRFLNGQTPEYEEEVLKNAFEKIRCHPHYSGFKKIIVGKYPEIKSSILVGLFGYEKAIDQGIYTLIKRGAEIRINHCIGFTASLLQTLEKEPHSSISHVLDKITPEDVFYFQLLEVMRTAYEERQIDRDGKSDLAVKKIEKEFFPWEELESELFSAGEPAEVVQYHLQKLLTDSSCNSEGDQAILGRLLIDGDEIDRKNGRGGHIIALQCAEGKFRFYDTIDRSNGVFSHGGFYEYEDQLEFCKALKRRAAEDLGSQYHQILLKFYIKK